MNANKSFFIKIIQKINWLLLFPRGGFTRYPVDLFMKKVALETPNKIKVLDIGAGHKPYENLFKHCFYESCDHKTVLDKISKHEKPQHSFYCDITKEIPKPDNYYDLIICNDVIEHVDDYNLFFIVLKKKMTTNGTIVGSIPNVRYVVNLYNLFFLKDWKYVNEGILDKTHLRFFTKKSLKRILIKHDFKIIKYKGINKVSISIKSIKSIIKYLLIFIFGKDTKYLQFGFCLKKISN